MKFKKIAVCLVALAFVFASAAFLNIPFSPLNIEIATPAKINNTIIVITNAISVIPFCLSKWFLI